MRTVIPAPNADAITTQTIKGFHLIEFEFPIPLLHLTHDRGVLMYSIRDPLAIQSI